MIVPTNVWCIVEILECLMKGVRLNKSFLEKMEPLAAWIRKINTNNFLLVDNDRFLEIKGVSRRRIYDETI